LLGESRVGQFEPQPLFAIALRVGHGRADLREQGAEFRDAGGFGHHVDQFIVLVEQEVGRDGRRLPDEFVCDGGGAGTEERAADREREVFVLRGREKA